LDALAVSASTLSASFAAGGIELSLSLASPMLWFTVFDILVLGVLILRRTYRFRLSGSFLDELGSVVIATVSATVVVIAVGAIVSSGMEPTSVILRWGPLATLNLAVVRVASHLVRRKRFLAGGGYPALIIGAGSVGRQVARRFIERPELGLRPVGFLDKEPRLNGHAELELPVLGASWDLEQHAIAYGVDHVVVAFSTAPHHVLVDIVRRSHLLGLHVLLVPRLFEEVPLGNNTEFAGGIPLLRIEPAARGWRLNVKYLIDRVAASVALLLAGPMLLTVALAVRCTSPGPVLFRQRRVGLDGREFDMLKFRTMTGSPDMQGEADAGWVFGSLAGAGKDEKAGPVDRRT